jgi:hypothetical protein
MVDCLDVDVLDVVGRFVELVRWICVTEDEIGLECLDLVLCYINLILVERGKMRLLGDKAAGKGGSTLKWELGKLLSDKGN